MRRRPLILCAALLLPLGVLVASPASPAHAQSSPASSAVRTGNHVHTYARPGQATHTVYVWGAVNQPGIWKVEPGTDLVEILSIIRPNGYGIETAGIQQDIILRVHRSTGGDPTVVHELKLDELLDMPPAQRPSLQAEDVLEVRTVEKRKFNFQMVTSVVGTLSSLALLGLRIFRR